MSGVPRLLAVEYDAEDPGRVAAFWSALLDRRPVTAADGVLLAGDRRQLGLRFVASRTSRRGRDRMHVHLTSDSTAAQHETVARALDLGGTHLDVGQRPDEGHVVLADPEGNELCVIEPGNGFLAGCGPLGELACEGAREVGVFWSRALGWPLVWDQDGETAVQSPDGGTKIAWGGPPVARRERPDRQRLVVSVPADRLPDQTARLESLGAARTASDPADLRLFDPGGTELRVVTEA